MNIAAMIAEWHRGCSCAESGKPEQCQECTRALIDAIDKEYQRIEERKDIDRAIYSLEGAESKLNDAVDLAKQAAKDLQPLFANRVQYMTAKRALKTMAAQPCEGMDYIPSPGVEDCNAALLACAITIEQRCWPCYARHVLNGGEP